MRSLDTSNVRDRDGCGLRIGRCPLILFVALIFASLAINAADAPASQQTSTYYFDIPRTNRVHALHELSVQGGGVLLGYLSTDDEEERALVGPVKGRMTIESALRVLLRSSMLMHRWIEPNMLAVEPI